MTVTCEVLALSAGRVLPRFLVAPAGGQPARLYVPRDSSELAGLAWALFHETTVVLPISELRTTA